MKLKVDGRSLSNIVWGLIVGAAVVLSPNVLAAELDPYRIGPNTTLTFGENRTALTQDSKERLSALIRNARTNGKIDEVQVAVWSDNPAPRQNEELSKPDRALADRRAKAVRDYLKKSAKVSVSTYNMAERASWLARTFDTDDAELKEEIGRGGTTPMSKAEFQVFKSNGMPSRAVILVVMKD